MNDESFLQPKLIGQRFEGGAIPLEFLRDLSILQEMLIEIAKLEYLKANEKRQRIPRYFAQSIEMRIISIDKGSAIPNIHLASPGRLFVDTNVKHYLNKALDTLVDNIANVAKGNEQADRLPPHILSYFKRFGMSLQQDEAIEFTSSRQEKVSLDRATRKKLVTASGIREYNEDISIRGMICALDKRAKTMDVEPVYGRRFTAPFSEQQSDVVIKALEDYHEGQGPRVLIQGTGIFDSSSSSSSPKAMATIEHISPLDPLDISARLDEFKHLQDGWLDGFGKALNHEGLDRLGAIFERHYPLDLQLPYLYPTEDAQVRAEWSLAPYDISLEVHLENCQAQWHVLNLDTDQDDVASYDLQQSEDWQQIIQKLSDLSSKSHVGGKSYE